MKLDELKLEKEKWESLGRNARSHEHLKYCNKKLRKINSDIDYEEYLKRKVERFDTIRVSNITSSTISGGTIDYGRLSTVWTTTSPTYTWEFFSRHISYNNNK